MLPLLRGKTRKLHERLFVELTYHTAYDPIQGIRTKQFKYIRSFADRPFWLTPNVDNGLTKDWYFKHCPELFQIPRPKEMLFDLSSDPTERRNLADKKACAHILLELRKELEYWMVKSNDPIRYGYVFPPKGARVTPARFWDPEEGVTEQFNPRTDPYGEESV